MGVQFDWQIDEEEERGVAGGGGGGGPWLRRGLVGLLLLLAAAGGFWGWGQWQIRQDYLAQRSALQAAVDRQAAAYAAGDGDAFFAGGPPDPAWQAYQLTPHSQSFWRGGPAVTDFERRESELWANVSWTDAGGRTRQRILFFEERGEEPVLLDRSPRFWDGIRAYEEPWGTLRLSAADEPWREEVSQQTARLLGEICAGTSCPPLTLSLNDRDFISANATQVVMLSPRLWGLDEQGAIDPGYWIELENRLRGRLLLQPITFAVPAGELNRYRDLAASYAVIFPGRQVELVAIESLAVEPAVLLGQVDGAALTPTPQLIAAGLVFDLTDLANTDPNFDQEDYYEQLWQGGRWRERLWYLPQTARLSVIYYDRDPFRLSLREAPQPGWTWARFWEDSRFLVEQQDFSLGLVTKDPDLLYSLAYNAGNSCEDEVTVFCSPQLRSQDVAAAYAAYLAQEALLADLTGLTGREKLNTFQNLVSLSTRTSPFWIDEPLMYEQHFLSRLAGVAPFPGSAQFAGVTPLWVDGIMISGTTDRPLAVWHWLKFLSYQYVRRTDRLIPARPSVAVAQRYWETLPRELGEVMRTAFPYSRPVLLGEQGLFQDETLGRLRAGELTPAEAAEIRPEIIWFKKP